jgi:choline dehydrogenase
MEGPANGFTMLGGMIRPVSRGTIRLSGPSAEDPLLIDPNVLACEADLDALVAAIELVRRIGAGDALSAWGARELYPGPAVATADAVRQYACDTAITYHHQVGTCKMGTDEAAVVDPLLCVRGVEGLRVADASVMPTVTTGNTNAPSIMIGERVAEFVAGHAPPYATTRSVATPSKKPIPSM